MRDRLPTPGKEGRVRFCSDNYKPPTLSLDESGHLVMDYETEQIEGVLEHADDATQQGSAYCKANVLPDTLCDTLGIDADESEPKDAFLALDTNARPVANYGKLVIRTLKRDGTPWAACQLTGIGDVAADRLVTNDQGYLAVNVTQPSYTISAVSESEYFDMGLNPVTVDTPPSKVTLVTMQEELLINMRREITTTRTIKFSNAVAEVDVFCVGGGAGGGAGGRAASVASGGGGGYTSTALGVIPTPDEEYPVIIGAGGTGCADSVKGGSGTAGGATSAMGVTANGGKPGGKGNTIAGGDGGCGGGGGGYAGNSSGFKKPGNGGTDGGNGGASYNSKGGVGQGTTTRPFGDASDEPPYAGGGGGSADSTSSYYGDGGTGGYYGGGNGTSMGESYEIASHSTVGLPNTGGGGGAGGHGDTGKDGGSGIVIIRWRLSA